MAFPNLASIWDWLDLTTFSLIMVHYINISYDFNWIINSLRCVCIIRTVNWLAGSPAWFYLTFKGICRSIFLLVDVYLSFVAMLITFGAIMFAGFSDEVKQSYGSLTKSMFTLVKLASFEDVWPIFADFEESVLLSATVQECGYAFLAASMIILGWTMAGIIANCGQEHFVDTADERRNLLMEQMGKSNFGITMKRTSSNSDDQRFFDRTIIGYDMKPGLNLFFRLRTKLTAGNITNNIMDKQQPSNFISALHPCLTNDKIPNHYKIPPGLGIFQVRPCQNKQSGDVISLGKVIMHQINNVHINSRECNFNINEIIKSTWKNNFNESMKKHKTIDQALKAQFLLNLYKYIESVKTPEAKQLCDIMQNSILQLKHVCHDLCSEQLAQAIKSVLVKIAIFRVVCEQVNSAQGINPIRMKDTRYYLYRRKILAEKLLEFQSINIEQTPNCRQVGKRIYKPK
ncbi:hypothetical protein GJ496_007656 [Pomphorhynchus laevis]|nr:hypothetical protein GJ496_007656 [Pomphorhynchus laevis]